MREIGGKSLLKFSKAYERYQLRDLGKSGNPKLKINKEKHTQVYHKIFWKPNTKIKVKTSTFKNNSPGLKYVFNRNDES